MPIREYPGWRIETLSDVLGASCSSAMSSSTLAMPLIPVETLNISLGALLLAVVLSAMIYGITCVQTFNYYLAYPKDQVYIKILVAVLWVLDSIHMSFVIIMVYHYTVTHWGDPVALAKTAWSAELHVVTGGVLTSVVQSFYAYRIYRLSRGSYILPCTIILLSLVQLGFGVAFVVHGFRVQFFALTATANATVITSLSISTGLINDLFISITMCILLHRSRTGWSDSSRIINTLITYTINTCAFLTVCTVGLLITFIIFPSALIDSIFYFALCRLYTNATMSTLNSRTSVGKVDTTTSINLSPMYTRPTASGDSKVQSIEVVNVTSDVHIHQPAWSAVNGTSQFVHV